MAGANYMGGRRNTARTRTKDVAGRMQKGHFMKQKHQILVRGLREHSLDDTKESHGEKSGRIEEIGFAHAQRDLQSGQSGVKQKTFIQPCTPSKGISQSSSSPGPSRKILLRRSKMLENLDINDPSGLKVTLRRLSRLPDLAGLNSFGDRPHPDKHNKRFQAANEPSRKRQKTSENSSSNSSLFHYESPTRRGDLSQAPLSHKLGSGQTTFISTQHQVNSSVQKTATLPEDYSYTNDSLDSQDGFSTIQEPGSGAEFPDSGFSELLFPDDLEPEDEEHTDPSLDTPEGWNADHDRPESPPSFKDSHTHNFTHKEMEYQAITQLAGQIPEAQEKPRDCSPYATTTQPPESQAHPASSACSLRQCLSLDGIFDKRFSSEENYDQDELQDWLDGRMRFGVGYVPPDPYVKYRPFVPLSTMLPSYSDEEDNDINLSAERMEDEVDYSQNSGEAVNLEEHLSSKAYKSNPPASLELSSSDSPASSITRYQPPLSQLTFMTPTRQRSPLSVHRNRPQSCFRLAPIVHDSVSSVLGRTTDSANISPTNKGIRSSHTYSSSFIARSSSPLASFRSSVAPRSRYNPLSHNTSNRRPNTPQQKSSATFHPSLVARFQNRSPESSVSPTVSKLLSANRDAGNSRRHITSLIINEARRTDNQRLSTADVEARAIDASKIFDGPDLFGGDDDDD